MPHVVPLEGWMDGSKGPPPFLGNPGQPRATLHDFDSIICLMTLIPFESTIAFDTASGSLLINIDNISASKSNITFESVFEANIFNMDGTDSPEHMAFAILLLLTSATNAFTD